MIMRRTATVTANVPRLTTFSPGAVVGIVLLDISKRSQSD